jgi:hypothetical protein
VSAGCSTFARLLSGKPIDEPATKTTVSVDPEKSGGIPMSTGVIIAIVVVVIVLAAALTTVMLRPGGMGGRNLHRRFGPEYDRVLRSHDGDTKATEKELTERVQRHGDLTTRPLSTQAREEYTAGWTAVQEHFIDSPREALAEADALIQNLARDRGFPDAGSSEHFDALSVHHARHLHGYRDTHEIAARGDDGTSTEEMREALVRARALFEDLMRADGHRAPSDRDTDRDRSGGVDGEAEQQHGGSRLGALGRRQN